VWVLGFGIEGFGIMVIFGEVVCIGFGYSDFGQVQVAFSVANVP
jgi:hypothetical protein